jgi:hypothetical protein
MSFDRPGFAVGGMSRRRWLAMTCGIAASAAFKSEAAVSTPFGAVIYGATPSGVIAAVAAAREGLRVGLITAGPVGGMCAQGLGFTDASNTNVIGGLARNFFVGVGKKYGRRDPAYLFEPSVAESVFVEMLKTAGVVVIPGFLSRVATDSRKVAAIVLTDGTIVRGRYFVDSSYEGDLMAYAGCAFTVGRESRREHHESFAGFNVYPRLYEAAFRNARGNLIDGVKPFPKQADGSGDSAIPAYTFRLCLSSDPHNRVPFTRPVNYDASRYILANSILSVMAAFTPGKLPGEKYDLNGNYFGASWGWPNGTSVERARIWRDHYDYQAGLLYFMATDSSVAKNIRDEVNAYGLAKDEFTSSGNWPTQLYVREARRLRGHHVLTQNDLQNTVPQSAPIGMGCYSFDVHATQLLAVSRDIVSFEGQIGPHSAALVNPYQIPYQSLLPFEFDNLLVSVCVSATHVAYSSLRVEPQYMIMGEAAGCAVGLAAHGNVRTGDVTGAISSRLKHFGAVLSLPA